MLSVDRRVREAIIIDVPPSTEAQSIKIMVWKIRECRVRLGIHAPDEMDIRRGELPSQPRVRPEPVVA